MSAQRRGIGDAESPNRPQISDDPEFIRRYLDAPTISANMNLPDHVASGGTDFVQEESPWGRSTNVVSDEDLYAMYLTETKEMLDTTSPSLPVRGPSSSSGFVQSKRSWQTSTEGVVFIEKDTLPDMHCLAPIHVNERTDPFITNLSSVCSGLDYPSTSKGGSSMDTDAGGAAGSHYVPMERELFPSGIRNDEIQCTLLDRERWMGFSRHGNEMMSRPNGCFLSPLLRFSISGLDKTTLYSIHLEFPRQNNYCWMYKNSTWQIKTTNYAQEEVPVMKHCRSPSRGDYWMTETVDFANLVICSRSDSDVLNSVCLETFHAYVPRITVVAVGESQRPIMGTQVSVSFPEAGFIVVTGHFRNPQVRRLKFRMSRKR